jgi:hypothetical protein
MEEKRPVILQRIRMRTILFHVLIMTPILLFWATIVASLERTPLTGRYVSVVFDTLTGITQTIRHLFRWRLILLSPEEEDQIAAQLAGQGWYQAVTKILKNQAEDGEMPTPIPVTDWRYQWVQSTLRRLESVIPILQDEAKLNPSWLETGPDDVQLPPPAEFPLRPRPRASEYLKMISDMTCGKYQSTLPITLPILSPDLLIRSFLSITLVPPTPFPMVSALMEEEASSFTARS